MLSECLEQSLSHSLNLTTEAGSGMIDSESCSSNIRTFLVEDDPVYRGILLELLKRRFPEMEVGVAGDAEQAYPLIESLKPDLVFLDIQLPGENGLQLTRRIKARQAGVEVIILTNCDVQEYRHAAFKQGASAFILKGSENCNAEIFRQVQKLNAVRVRSRLHSLGTPN